MLSGYIVVSDACKAHNGRVTFVDDFSAMKVNGLYGENTDKFNQNPAIQVFLASGTEKSENIGSISRNVTIKKVRPLLGHKVYNVPLQTDIQAFFCL